jgi:LAGLIDADG DNA endonuclease family
MRPKISISKPHKTGNIYTTVRFSTFSLPCFVELHNFFYLEGKKIIPVNIVDLLTPRGLAYWICDAGSFDKTSGRVFLSTNSFSLDEVKLLVSVLTDKFNLKCTISRERTAYKIVITRKALPGLQILLKNIMPPMMLHKIGL